jgi:hypothetical protein
MMVFLVPQDGTGPVQLFCKDQSDELVGKGQSGERPDKIGTLEDGLVDPIGSSDQKHQPFRPVDGPLLNKRGQFNRVHFLAMFIQRYQEIILLKPIEDGTALADPEILLTEHTCIPGDRDDVPFQWEITIHPAGEILHTTPHIRLMRLANRPDLNLHSRVLTQSTTVAANFHPLNH